MNVLNILTALVMLMIVPVMIGNTTYGILKRERTLTESFVFGHITMWAICQLVSVPLILLKVDFRVLIVLLTLIYILYIVYGLVKRYNCRLFMNIAAGSGRERMLSYIAMLIMALAVLLLVVASIVLQHTDADDSRFVVNSVDTFRTNRMLLTDVNTGLEIYTWIGDLNKDVSSPWAVYCAYLAKIMMSHPTIVMHTFLPPVLLLMACAVYWLLSEQLIGSDVVHRCVFVCMVILVEMYGCYSVYSAETFLLTRIWQGKAVVAGVGIPVIIWQFLCMYHHISERTQLIHGKDVDVRNSKEKTGRPYMSGIIMLAITNTAMSLLSNMGIILGCFLTGCYGLVYGLEKKNWKYTIFVWLACVPNIIYIAVSFAV